ncbi:MAG: 30S ribosomal protein S7 [Candidatus Aenigmatarchaeota archaeon]
MDAKLFGKWGYDAEVTDLGLKSYINLKPRVIPRSCGRAGGDKNVVELLITHLMVPGHKGKKHRTTSGQCTGKYATVYSIVEDTFDVIAEKTKANPVEAFVKAIENSAPYELTISQQMGGIVARKPAICAPRKRLDLVIRRFVQGAYQKSFSGKKPIVQTLSAEILAAYKNSAESFAIQERQRNEREAEGAR